MCGDFLFSIYDNSNTDNPEVDLAARKCPSFNCAHFTMIFHFLDFRSSRFARLQSIQCAMAGKNLYIRFSCSTGDAMGMNMVSKGVQNVLDFLQNDFPDMDVIGISGEPIVF